GAGTFALGIIGEIEPFWVWLGTLAAITITYVLAVTIQEQLRLRAVDALDKNRAREAREVVNRIELMASHGNSQGAWKASVKLGQALEKLAHHRELRDVLLRLLEAANSGALDTCVSQ